MNQENKALQTSVSAGEYTTPKIKVKELRNRKVLCASDEEFSQDPDNEQYGYQDGNGWFNK